MDLLRFEESGLVPNTPSSYEAQGSNKLEPTTEELIAQEYGNIDPWFLVPDNIAWTLDGLAEYERVRKVYDFLNSVEAYGDIAMRADENSDQSAFLAIDSLSEIELDLLKAGNEAMQAIFIGSYEQPEVVERDRREGRVKRMLGGTAVGAVGGLTPLMLAFPYWAQAGMYGLGVLGASVVSHGAYEWVKDVTAVRKLEKERDAKTEVCVSIFEALSQKFENGAVVIPSRNFNINLEALRKSDDPAIAEFHSVIEAHQDSVTNVTKDIVDVALQGVLGDKHEFVKKKKRKKIKALQFNPFLQLSSMLESVARLDESMVDQVWRSGVAEANIEPLKQIMVDITVAHENLLEHARKVKVVREIDGHDKDDSVALNNLGAVQLDLQAKFTISVLRFLRCRQGVMRYLSRGHNSKPQWPLLGDTDNSQITVEQNGKPSILGPEA